MQLANYLHVFMSCHITSKRTFMVITILIYFPNRYVLNLSFIFFFCFGGLKFESIQWLEAETRRRDVK